MPDPARPTAIPARSGRNTRAPIAGAGIQMIAPPSPMKKRATPRMAAEFENAAAPSDTVEIVSPNLTSWTKVIFDDAHDTSKVPNK